MTVKIIKIIRLFLLKIVLSITGSLLVFSIIFCIGFKIEYPNRNLFDYFKASPVQSDMVFDNISAINIHATNIDLTILESETDKVLIKNSIETTGIGIFTKPKIWVSNNTLFYDQGLIMNIDTWEIIEDNFDLEIHTSGSLIIEVPIDMKLDFIIKNANGNINFDIDEANNVDIIYSNKLDFRTKCETLKITVNEQNVNIYKPITNIKAFTKSGNVSIYANDKTNSIDFVTKSGYLNIFPDRISGYNHNGKYTSLSNEYNHTIDINSIEVNIYDNDTINELSSFSKEDN